MIYRRTEVGCTRCGSILGPYEETGHHNDTSSWNLEVHYKRGDLLEKMMAMKARERACARIWVRWYHPELITEGLTRGIDIR